MTWRNFLKNYGQFPEKVLIFDTTLRDGEQTPGVALLPKEKLKIAKQLDKLGVDSIEAGFPITSKGEFEAVKLISDGNLDAEIVGLARSVQKDIDCAIDSGVDCVHTFIATSDIHIQKKLEISKEEVLEKAVWSVKYIKSHGLVCEFSAEDATRSDINFLKKVYRAVVKAGADRIDIPDTVGVAIPKSMGNLVGEINNEVSIPIAVHCHDDLGLAVANTLAGIESGAKEAHVTINGLGERAGNASLEEIALCLYVFYDIKTNLSFKEIYRTSKLVSELTGIRIPPNKAVVGDNAFAHESGIHTDGILKSPKTYELLPPELVGHKRRILAGKHAGKHGVESILRELGFSLNTKELEEVVTRVKDLGDKGRKIAEEELLNIVDVVSGSVKPENRRIKLEDLIVVTGNKTTPTATVRLTVDGKEYKNSELGLGPIDAVLKAIQNIMIDVAKFRLVDFKLDAITGGSDALANVRVKLMDNHGRIISAMGIREDIVMAGVEAVINAANRLLNINSMKDKKRY